MKPVYISLSTMGLIFISPFFTGLMAQNRIYVNANAAGGNNGHSWASAFQNLNNALDAAQEGDSVWVAQGIYTPTLGSDRTISFVQKSGVRLYGGFVGTETNLNQRDWQSNPVILSGDIGLPSDSTDNSYTILYMENPDSMTVLDGFHFRHGIANYSSVDQPVISPYKCGGALYIMAMNGWGYALVQNCHFAYNYAYSHGGAVYVNGSGTGSVAPQFINCTFEHNHSRLDGGALYRNGGSWAERSPDFGNCLFKNNFAARRGGGLCYNESERTDWTELEGCIFLNNHSNTTGGGANFYVGRVTGTKIAMGNCRFEGNGYEGGTDQGEAFALFSSNGLDMGHLVIDSCVFFQNDPGHIFYESVIGGEFKLLHSKVESNGTADITSSDFNRSLFHGCDLEMGGFSVGAVTSISNNTITSKKGSAILGLGNLLDTVLISNNLFLHQIKPSRTIYVDVFNNNASINISNNTIVNATTLLWAITSSKIKFSNCILNDWEVIKGPNSLQVNFDYCLFENDDFCQNPQQSIVCGPNNLYDLDPQFRDPTNQDYSLLPCSPLINAGNNLPASNIPTDLAGNTRIQGGTVDIGAYESPAFSLAAEPQVNPACVGASNGSISISPVFGCEPYLYNWFPDVGNGPTLNGLPPGNYLLTITDGSNQQIRDTVVVAAVDLPELVLAASDVQCGGQVGGSLSATVLSGKAPFAYQWLPSAADTAQLVQQQPGDYSLTVVDANGCQDSASANIALQGVITLAIGGQIIRCHGETGWLSATPSTGAAPFSWQWTGWIGTDSLAQPLGPGSYSVTVTDAYGCTASNTFPIIMEPGLLSATVGTSEQTDLVMPNGAAVVTTISGGTPAFEFDWNTGSTMQAIAGLSAGMYTVTVTDKNGCEAVVEVVVDLMVGTDEAEGTALMLYPNPAFDWVTVVLPSNPRQPSFGLAGGPSAIPGYMVELSDASGRVLRTTMLAEASDCTFDLSLLPVGGYLVVVRNGIGAAVFVGKVVKR
jgi:hypothetical protein